MATLAEVEARLVLVEAFVQKCCDEEAARKKAEEDALQAMKDAAERVPTAEEVAEIEAIKQRGIAELERRRTEYFASFGK